MVSTHSKWTDDGGDTRRHFGHLIHDVARQLKRQFEAAAQRHDLTLTQWRVIGQLSVSDGLSQSALAGLCDTDPMTISGVVERLEAKHLITREPDPGDSRAKIVLMTDKSRALVGEMRTLAEEVTTIAFEGIDPADRDTAMRVLTQMSANLSGQRASNKEELV